ncbi:MAG: DNA alkylation repair protein, partial [Prevotella salivae]|nr:DNA alkylation repair protein [Segatella salivae]
LFGKQMEPNERGINEFLDQASVAFSTENLGVKHAALNAVMSFAALGQDYENIARKALQGIIEI